MSSARVSEKSSEEEDLLDRSKKKPKGSSHVYSGASSLPVSYEDVVEEPKEIQNTPLVKSFAQVLEGRSEEVSVDHDGRPPNYPEYKDYDIQDFSGITVVEKLLGKYECRDMGSSSVPKVLTRNMHVTSSMHHVNSVGGFPSSSRGAPSVLNETRLFNVDDFDQPHFTRPPDANPERTGCDAVWSKVVSCKYAQQNYSLVSVRANSSSSSLWRCICSIWPSMVISILRGCLQSLGRVCLNTDGAAKANNGGAGCGGVIRNDDGGWLGGFAVNLGECSAYVTELWGVFHGLKVAQSKGYTDVELQIDSKSVACALQAEEKKGRPVDELKLYSYWWSSCAFRVRIVLNLKSLHHHYIPVNVIKGEQFHPEFKKLNPVGYVPVLVDGPVVLADSFAIIMYLEDKYPEKHPLLPPPSDIPLRALNLQVASIVSSSIQPLQNLNVLNYIEDKLGSHETLPWIQSVVRKGFSALEELLKDRAGKYATGDQLYLADVFLAPQLYASFTNYKIHTDEFPTLSRLYATYIEIPAIRDALPDNQPDAEHS
ncbi:hypothetical protein RIF29_42177 [Crotalaria pallida]|uniref:glutathione transferase n=1 Tax=Crotalaria pallida TaxID=3830 RepID=A0AAN9E736_CROPI